MKKVILFADEKYASALNALVARFNDLKVVAENPDIVITCGGDGTYLRAQHQWPNIPKLILRGSAICKLCSPLTNEDVLKKYLRGDYKIEKLPLLEAEALEKKIVGVNDIVVHNADPRHAIRYRIQINKNQIGEKDIIGDGIVVATPLGSTGYYRSITDSVFSVGVGLAFNNSTEQSDHMVLQEHAIITMRITRGPAMVYADNQEESIELKEGDEVIIRQSKKTAERIQII